MPPKDSKISNGRIPKTVPPVPPDADARETGVSSKSGAMNINIKSKKSALGVRAAIEDAQLLSTDNIDDYETCKTTLRGRRAVVDEDRRAVQDLERWSGPQFKASADNDF